MILESHLEMEHQSVDESPTTPENADHPRMEQDTPPSTATRKRRGTSAYDASIRKYPAPPQYRGSQEYKKDDLVRMELRRDLFPKKEGTKKHCTSEFMGQYGVVVGLNAGHQNIKVRITPQGSEQIRRREQDGDTSFLVDVNYRLLFKVNYREFLEDFMEYLKKRKMLLGDQIAAHPEDATTRDILEGHVRADRDSEPIAWEDFFESTQEQESDTNPTYDFFTEDQEENPKLPATQGRTATIAENPENAPRSRATGVINLDFPFENGVNEDDLAIFFAWARMIGYAAGAMRGLGGEIQSYVEDGYNDMFQIMRRATHLNDDAENASHFPEVVSGIPVAALPPHNQEETDSSDESTKRRKRPRQK
jgi:hypothetical protein